jgi:hypothetical protein
MKTLIIAVCVLILGNGCTASQSSVISATTTQPEPAPQILRPAGPLPGDFKKVVIENRSNQIYWQTSFLGHNALLPPGTRIIVKVARPFGGLSPVVGQFYFVGYAYQLDENGKQILVGQNRFYAYLDGTARPYWNGQNYEWCGSWVVMDYFQPTPYGFPTTWSIGGGGLPSAQIDLILSPRRSGYSRSYYRNYRHR